MAGSAWELENKQIPLSPWKKPTPTYILFLKMISQISPFANGSGEFWRLHNCAAFWKVCPIQTSSLKLCDSKK